MSTVLKYHTESYRKEHTSRIQSCICPEPDICKAKVRIICDETIFYPQGGGQPTDIGTLTSGDKKCEVNFVSYNRETGVVSHDGMMIMGDNFQADEQVKMEIDWDVRYLHMRLHSGGHLIDHAIQFLGSPFRATKANHFPSGPSVEFQVLDTVAFPTDRPSLDKFMVELQAKCDELISKDMAVLAFEEEAGQEDSSMAATHVEKAKKVERDKIRMVLFEGCPAAVPCGGTHVARVSEIGRVIIKKLTYKDQLLRISYRIE